MGYTAEDLNRLKNKNILIPIKPMSNDRVRHQRNSMC